MKYTPFQVCEYQHGKQFCSCPLWCLVRGILKLEIRLSIKALPEGTDWAKWTSGSLSLVAFLTVCDLCCLIGHLRQVDADVYSKVRRVPQWVSFFDFETIVCFNIN